MLNDQQLQDIQEVAENERTKDIVLVALARSYFPEMIFELLARRKRDPQQIVRPTISEVLTKEHQK